MTRAQLVLASLVAGVIAGVALRWSDVPALVSVARTLLPLGQMWVHALQMTLIPLVFAMIVHGVASAVQQGRGGRLIGLTLVVFLVAMAVAAAIGTVMTEAALHIWPLPSHALDSLLAGQKPDAVPSLADQLLAIVPINPVAAAAGGQIFPLVVFGLAFGAAIATLSREADGGEPVVMRVLSQIAQAMMKIVDWVLMAAPLGIFLLAIGLGLDSGFGVARVLGVFIALCFATTIVMTALCYVVVRVAGLGSLKRFASAIAPAQALAAGSSSSMAATPAMIEAAVDRLGISEDVAGLVIPLAVSIFRLGTAAHAVAAVLVAAHAVGIEPGPLQLVLAGVAVVLGTISGAGLPGAAVIYAIYGPGIQFLGAPMAILPLYVAVIALPDPIITLCSVTGDLTAAALVDRLIRGRAAEG
ncbi:dicarboxylate/amino acid:cation symporter [Novosphingobium sp. 9]|uniref:dicarboxylate/amino acid:cation symporter n=1 Tax=Novosphingobium sp. 9 TaxID=2025349 RepID=UPI0021B530D1|nr:dicarboxylate/amino acid:cation symporter [Novosphingobium sp. 9]